MTKVLYNGEYIELEDELESGYKELDLLTAEEKQGNLKDTVESNSINLEDTLQINVFDLEDTQELNLGETNE